MKKDRFSDLDTWGRLLLWKAYFDRGYTITHYIKYLVLLFGIYDLTGGGSVKATVYLILFYGIFCFVLGKFWIWSKMVDRENEIQNRINPFQRQLRETLKIQKVYK